MDIEYLEKADADQSSIFERTIDTYAHLESKARYIASAFVAILSAYIGVVISGFAGLEFWQQAALVGLAPSLFCTFYHLVDSLKAREYQDGFLIEYGEKQSPTKQSYLSQKTRTMREYIKTNSDQNTDKANAVNGAFVCLVSAVPASAAASLSSALFPGDTNNLALFVFGWLLVVSVACVFTYGFSRHFGSRL